MYCVVCAVRPCLRWGAVAAVIGEGAVASARFTGPEIRNWGIKAKAGESMVRGGEERWRKCVESGVAA